MPGSDGPSEGEKLDLMRASLQMVLSTAVENGDIRPEPRIVIALYGTIMAAVRHAFYGEQVPEAAAKEMADVAFIVGDLSPN